LGDLSSAALALHLSNETRTPVVISDKEEHLEDLEQIEAVRISNLGPE